MRNSTNNLSWETVAIAAGNVLQLGVGSGDALYVGLLSGVDISGATITNIDGAPGLFIYYDPTDNPLLHGDYNLTGGGELLPMNNAPLTGVPEPGTWVLFAAGVGSLVGHRRWLSRHRVPKSP